MCDGGRNVSAYNQQDETSSVWAMIQPHIGNLLEDAFTGVPGLKTFSDILKPLLEKWLNSLLGQLYWCQTNHTAALHDGITHAVESSFSEVNQTVLASNESLKLSLTSQLKNIIEMDLFNLLVVNSSDFTTHQPKDFFHSLPLKDETLFVALVCMGSIVPIIFISLFFIYFYKRRHADLERRKEMLLRDQSEMSMEDYSTRPQTDLDITVVSTGSTSSSPI
ncbi:uncharacterized protein LOC131927444 [Physella acuta]|uniref:uncharacterized protein LOC131927444 n=1 Tax=Physella acuta TaxID=109671 RepID=UPI0027DD33A1|nr:uncharacterized protein LOC131927444 [Physella acuta]